MMLNNPPPDAPDPERGHAITYLRCERARASPAAFRALTGLSPAAFDALLCDLEPRHRAAREARLARPGRRRAPGGGNAFILSFGDRALLALTWARHRTWVGRLGLLFGVAEVTALRVRKAVLPLLASPCRPEFAPSSREERERLLALFASDLPELHTLLAMYLGLDWPPVEYDPSASPLGSGGEEGLPGHVGR